MFSLLSRPTAKRREPELLVLPLPDVGSARRWKIERDRVLLGFIEKLPDRFGERHPYKVIAPAFGPGGARLGDMVEADYRARDAFAAAKAALPKLIAL